MSTHDVIVVGAGIAGASTAFFLASRSELAKVFPPRKFSALTNQRKYCSRNGPVHPVFSVRNATA